MRPHMTRLQGVHFYPLYTYHLEQCAPHASTMAAIRRDNITTGDYMAGLRSRRDGVEFTLSQNRQQSEPIADAATLPKIRAKSAKPDRIAPKLLIYNGILDYRGNSQVEAHSGQKSLCNQ